MRKLALNWWRDLNEEQRRIEVKAWVAETGDWRRHWDYHLISKSDHTIETIFLWKRTKI